MAETHRLEQPVLNIVGERVALGPLRRDLLPLYLRWINDLAAAHWLGLEPRPMTVEARTAWYDRAATGEDLVFTIYAREEWRPIGTCALKSVDHRHGTAGIGVHIGDVEDRGKGYGTEAVRLLLDVAFTALGLHNVMLSVDASNLAGVRAYTRAGFNEIGRRRQAIRGAAGRSDEIYMDCLTSEFVSPVLGRVFASDGPRP
ncbi:MAG TPA: GNAT family protein [Thermomicrobiales bacterium]|nr:GNAT family protein [Thermomicrobiales bacterium]